MVLIVFRNDLPAPGHGNPGCGGTPLGRTLSQSGNPEERYLAVMAF
jgi:hypothetical protein